MSWRDLGGAVAAAVLALSGGIGVACGSDKFESCEETRTCKSDEPDAAAGAGGSGQGGTAGGGAGTSSAGAAGASGAGAGGVAGSGGAGSGGTAGSGGDAGHGGGAGTGMTTCPEGYADCNDDDADGCEIDLRTNTEHCGRCWYACSQDNASAGACVAGACEPACQSGFGDCGTPGVPIPDDGCETSLDSVDHCGACGHQCSSANVQTRQCSGGSCTPVCKPGFGDCSVPGSPSSDDGCETNLRTSATSCGRCDHDCLGGTCASGMCQPITLCTGQTNPIAVAVDATHVYWINSSASGSVRKTPKSAPGGDQCAPVASGLATPQGLALDAGSVYFTTIAPSGQLQRVAKSGGMPTVLHTGLSDESLTGVAVQGAFAYFGKVATSGSRIIARNDASSNSGYTVLADNADGLTGTIEEILVDPSRVYFGGSDVGHLPIGGGAAVKKGTGGSDGLAIDATHIYTSTFTLGISRATFAGPLSQVVSPAKFGRAIVVDDSRVYWTNASDKTIDSAPKSGGAAVPLASGLGVPQGIAQDSAAIYWVDSGDGTVRKVAK